MTDLAVPLVNVGRSPVADDDLGAVEEGQAVEQEGKGDEGQGGREDGGAGGLLDAEQGYHDDLEEHHGGDDVLEDLHPQLHHNHTSHIISDILTRDERVLSLMRTHECKTGGLTNTGTGCTDNDIVQQADWASA